MTLQPAERPQQTFPSLLKPFNIHFAQRESTHFTELEDYYFQYEAD